MTKLEYLEKYKSVIRMKKYSEMTLKSYVYHLELFFNNYPQIGIINLSSQNIHDYLLYLNGKDVSDSYFNQSINAIKFFFEYVLVRKVKDYLVIRPKKAKTQPILLAESEIQALVDKCKNKKHKAIIMLILSAGLRVSEVVNLKIEDIDSKLMIIRIINSKGRKSRQVLLDERVLVLLREYYREYQPQTWLFYGQFGKDKQYTSRSIEQFVKDYAKEAGLTKHVHPHLLRHQQITGLIENGTDIYTAQYHSGHSSTKTTSGYIHLSPKFISKINSPINNITL